MKLADSQATSTIKELRLILVALDACTAHAGGDTHMDFDDRNRLSSSIYRRRALLPLFQTEATPSSIERIRCCIGGGDDPEGATDDRQWAAPSATALRIDRPQLAVAVGSGNFNPASSGMIIKF